MKALKLIIKFYLISTVWYLIYMALPIVGYADFIRSANGHKPVPIDVFVIPAFIFIVGLPAIIGMWGTVFIVTYKTKQAK